MHLHLLYDQNIVSYCYSFTIIILIVNYYEFRKLKYVSHCKQWIILLRKGNMLITVAQYLTYLLTYGYFHCSYY
jgi:hypothetical protein